MMLAQAAAQSSSSELLPVVCVVITTVVALIALIYGMSKKSTERIVTFSPNAATKEELLELKRTTEATFQHIAREGKEDRRLIYEHVDKVRVEIKTDLNGQTRHLESKMDTQLATIISAVKKNGDA